MIVPEIESGWAQKVDKGPSLVPSINGMRLKAVLVISIPSYFLVSACHSYFSMLFDRMVKGLGGEGKGGALAI